MLLNPLSTVEVESMSLERQQLGRYHLLSLLGSGGMGNVYLAEDALIDRQIAIKVIRSEASPHPESTMVKEASRLFLREAKAIAKLNHPHILPLFDFGEETIEGVTLTYMVMPFCPDGSLSDWLQQRDKTNLPSVHEVAYLLDQAADALQYAHDQQIVHQDVKPHNFLIRRGRQAILSDLLLTDFGIAKVTAMGPDMSYAVRGTPTYMAPEQWEGHPVPATDQYALAAMVYQLLTGRPVFQGGRISMIYQHAKVQPQPPSTFNPHLTAETDQVILRALAKSPADRFPSVSSFAQTFKEVALGGEPPIAPAISTEAIHHAATVDTDAGTPPTAATPISDQDNTAPFIGLTEDEDSDVSNDENRTVATMTFDEEDNEVPTMTLASADDEDSVSPSATHKAVEPDTPAVPVNTGSASPPVPVQLATPHRFSRVGTIALVGVSLLLIAISAQLLYSFTNARNQGFAMATATAQARASSFAALTTTQANATATGQVNATATSQVNTTSTASANATATVYANATATASIIAANPDPYPPQTGMLAFYDPMTSNTNGHIWTDYKNSVSDCSFNNDGMHVIETKPSFFANCFAAATNFSNFTYEVQMDITQGDCGGIMFRADQTHNKFYYFRVCQNGSLALYTFVDNTFIHAQTLTMDSKPAIHKGLNQENTLAVVANGIEIDLYVNQQLVGSTTDNTYTHGQIAVVAEARNGLTEVVFTNARVWSL